MSILTRILTSLLMPIFVGGALYLINRQNNREMMKNLGENHIVVHLPKALFWVGSAVILCLSAITVYMLSSPDEPLEAWMLGISAAFMLLGIFMVVSFFVWRIDIFRGRDCFTVRTYLGRKYTVRYDECISYSDGRYGLSIKTAERKISVDTLAANTDFLIEELNAHGVRRVSDFTDEHGEVCILRANRGDLAGGLITMLLGLGATAWILIDPANFADELSRKLTVATFSVFFVLGLLISLVSGFSRVTVNKNEDFFVYKFIFWERKIKFSDCEYYKLKNRRLSVRANGRTYYFFFLPKGEEQAVFIKILVARKVKRL